MTTTATAPTAPAPTTIRGDRCTGCGQMVVGEDLNYGDYCSDDTDAYFGDCCYTAHRDLGQCACLTEERNQ